MPDPRPALSPLAAWGLTVAATATMAVSYVDRQAIAVLAPTITEALRLSETEFGWLGSAFSLAYLVCTPFAGRYVEAVGARVGLLLAVTVWSAVAASHALAPGLWTLVALRILLGWAESPTFPAAAQTVARALPPASRNAAFGLLFTGSSLGAAVAAVLLPALEARYGWRLALVGTAMVGLAWIPAWLVATASPAARAALAPTPSAAAEPFAWRELARSPAVQRALLAVVASAPVNGFVLQWGAKVLVARHDVAQAAVGHYLWLPPVLFDLGAVGFGALAALLRGTQRALFAVATLLLLGVGALGEGSTPWQTTVVMALALAGGAGVYTLLTADVISRVAPSRVAVVGGLTAAAQSLSLVVAFPLIGRVLDATGSYGIVGMGLAAWAVPGTLAWLLWEPRPAR